MRIAVVMTGGLHPSGREQIIPVYVGVFSALAARHDVHAFVLRHLAEATSYTLNGMVVHDLGRPSARFGLGRVAQWRALAKALAAAGPFDVVHGIWADPAGLLAALTGKVLRIPSVVSCTSGEFVAHPDLDYGLQRSRLGRALVRLTVAGATRVHVASGHAAALAARLGVTTTTIPLGLAVPAEPAVDRPAGPPWRLLQVASLNRVKQQRLLLEAVALLRDRVDVQLDLVGEDTLDGSLRGVAGALGIAERVRFHGFLPQDALGPLRARAHLYVQTSRHEGAGVSVLEAAAAGLPVIGTPVGYLADWAPGAAAAVSDPSPRGFAEAIGRLLADPERRAAIAGNALAFARAHDVLWSAGALERLYREIAGSPA